MAEDWWAYAAEISDSLGADVVSASVGYSLFDYEWQNIYTPADNNGIASIASRAASILAQKGVIVVNSAGNQGNTPWWLYIIRPADAFNILAVGAVDAKGTIAVYSSYGPSADGRVKPDVVTPGHRAWAIVGYWSLGEPPPLEVGTIGRFGGTSAAAPIIAGLSACLWQALPQYSSLEIMDLIRKYGDRYNNPNNRYGYGIPNFYQCYLDNVNSVPEKQISSVLVYPNPTTGELRIKNYELRIKEIQVFDVFGRTVGAYPCGRPETTINISHLPQGVYIVKIMADGHIYTHKIIKTNQ